MAAVIAIAGGATGAAAIVWQARDRVIEPAPRDAGEPVVIADAGITGPGDAPADASVIIAEPPDDARVIVRVPRRDAGELPGPDPLHPSIPDTPNHRGTILVQVITKPDGGNLFEGTHYRGPSGTQLEEPLGTTLAITCRHPGYRPGKVEIKFDGKLDTALCVLERIKICVDNIKNPFDDCELDPGAEKGSAPAPPKAPTRNHNGPVVSPGP